MGLMKVYLTIVLRKLFCVYEVLSCLSFGRDKNPAFNPMAGDPTNSWTSSAPPVEGENDTMSNAQRSTLKWEKEEALGEMATVAPVLYTNIHFPNLKEEYPGKSWVCHCFPFDWLPHMCAERLWVFASLHERARCRHQFLPSMTLCNVKIP